MYKYLHPSTVIWSYHIPCLICKLGTLSFNIVYHPPQNSKICKAIDLTTSGVAFFIGETYHLDHHYNPAKLKRPGFDLPYYLIIYPLLKLKLIKL